MHQPNVFFYVIDAPSCPTGEKCAHPHAVAYDGQMNIPSTEIMMDIIAPNVGLTLYVLCYN